MSGLKIINLNRVTNPFYPRTRGGSGILGEVPERVKAGPPQWGNLRYGNDREAYTLAEED